ncbi:MAG: hypothetical protein H6754_00530 [Candidatus Omnitrophica bacterium]|nr:hypothetical protein [Candidatus Omnitrophota bacterium]
MKTPVLSIVTDLSDTRWLEYILVEFKRINLCQADIKIVSLADEQAIGHSNKIFYSQRFCSGFCVPQRQILPNGKVHYIKGDLYVLDQTIEDDERFTCSYDIFWNAFAFLSRLEEYQLAQNHRSSMSHRILHPRQDRHSLTIPIVNLLFNRLEDLVTRNFPEITFGVSAKPRVEFSHDIDYLSKSIQFMAKQSILNAYDFFRFFPRFGDMGKSFLKSVSFLFSRPSYWTFEYWEEIEKRYNTRSIFYIHAKAIKKNFLTWIIDPNYDLLNHPRLQKKLKDLLRDGFEIGLHGSYYSAVDGEIMAKEKAILEKVIERPVTKIRQHWLRYNELVTPYIHNKLFEYDSTLGWNDRIGFRSGCASQYHPYDHKNKKGFEIIETPQIIMDFNIYQSLVLENKYFMGIALDIISKLDECKSACVAVSWHERACTSDYEWHATYEMILERVSQLWGTPHEESHDHLRVKNENLV